MSSGLDLSKVPAAAAPTGAVTNLYDPEDQWRYLLPTCIVSWAITVPAVVIRIFTKLRVHGRLQYEDYILSLALSSLLVWTVLLIVQPTHGAHIWDTSMEDLAKFAYWSNLLIILYVPCVLLAKWAILLQLSRIFSIQPRSGTWWVIRALIWTSTIFYITMLGIDIFQCVPREKIWNPDLPGKCYSVVGILLGTSFFNIVLNFIILALPLVILKRIQMQARKKLTVCAVFAVAGLAFISSIMRAIYGFIFAYTHDPTRTMFPVALWAVAEISCVIFATTFPTMPLFITYVRKGRAAARRKTGYASQTLAARGNLPPDSDNRRSVGVIHSTWYSFGATEQRASAQGGTGSHNEPWDAMPSMPQPVVMTALDNRRSLRESISRDTVGTKASFLGGIGVTKTFGVEVTPMV